MLRITITYVVKAKVTLCSFCALQFIGSVSVKVGKVVLVTISIVLKLWSWGPIHSIFRRTSQAISYTSCYILSTVSWVSITRD